MKIGEVITKIQKKLKDSHDFVKVLDVNTVTIIEDKNLGNPNTLQKVHFTNIPFKTTTIWWLDKLEEQILGFTPIGETPEALFCVPDFATKKLYVYFVEMKSRIRKPKLVHIYGKFNTAIARFFFLLTLNERQHQQTPQYLELKIVFRGLVFYLQDDPANTQSTNDFRNNLETNPTEEPSLAAAFLNGKGMIDFSENFLGKHKVETKFFAVPFGETEFEITYEDLVTKF